MTVCLADEMANRSCRPQGGGGVWWAVNLVRDITRKRGC